MQAENLRAWNKARDQNKTVDREAAVQSINEKYQNQALELAKTHGYVEEVKEEKQQDLPIVPEPKAVKIPQAKPEVPIAMSEKELKIQKFIETRNRITRDDNTPGNNGGIQWD